jgi:hypothetical protein
MKNRQMAPTVYALKAANDEEFASFESLTRQTAAEDAHSAKRGWDPFEVWRTRIKPRGPSSPRER